MVNTGIYAILAEQAVSLFTFLDICSMPEQEEKS